MPVGGVSGDNEVAGVSGDNEVAGVSGDNKWQTCQSMAFLAHCSTSEEGAV